MTESTAIEQPAGDIASDLSDAFSGFDDNFNEIPDPVNDEGSSGEQEVEQGQQTEYDQDPQSEVDNEGGEDGGEEQESEPGLEPPSNWSPSDKDKFSKAPKELQSWLLDRHKAMEGDYTRKTQEIADLKNWAPVQELFAPHLENMRANGQTPASVVMHWANINDQLSKNPEQTLQYLAQQYGVSLAQTSEGEQPAVDPQVVNLRQEIQQLKNSVVQREQAEAQQRLTNVQQELYDFADQKTEAGDLAHPYFDQVVDDMVSLARAEQASGKTPQLADLYEKAVWANPTVREQVLSAQRQAAAIKAEKEAKAKAAKAMAAKKTIPSKPDSDSSSDLTLRQEIEQAFNF